MSSLSSRAGRFCWMVCVCAVLATGAGAQQLPSQYYKVSTDGSPIPDVNKVNPANPADASCWLASASNILAAAGYGTGPAAQQRAQNIYGQLLAAYGPAVGGAPDQAISHWLAMYGKNPDSPEFRPQLAYTDVTAEYRALGAADYAFLKNELYRCQYVGVQFENPAHAMTMVGWDDTLGRSIWHDSDYNTVFPGDDYYGNAFTASPVDWDLTDPANGTTYLDHANGYVTFCPGLNKDLQLMTNYDVAWAPGPNGPAAREAGMMKGIYDPLPGWQPSWMDPVSQLTFDPFQIDNQLDPFQEKTVELLVDYYGRDVNYLNEDIRLRYFDRAGMEVVALPTSKQLSADNGQVLFTWELDYQPDWEEILFPSYMEYGFLEGKVASWDVALICTPKIFPLGDFNGDCSVTGADYVLWANNFGGDDSIFAPGSCNADGAVTGADYVTWANNFGHVGCAPEPATISLLVLGSLAVLRRRGAAIA